MNIVQKKRSTLMVAALMALLVIVAITATQGWTTPAQAAAGDNTPADATDLGDITNTGYGQKLNQTLGNPDTDRHNYYKFVLTDQKEIRIVVNKQETGDAELTIVDEDDNMIFKSNVTGSYGSGSDKKYNDEIDWKVIGPGTWYIRIYQTNAVNNNFDLKWWVRNGVNFPGDDCAPGIWTTCEVGGLYTNTNGMIANVAYDVSRNMDKDWYEFTLPVDNVYRITVTPTGSNMQPIMMVYDQYGQFIAYSFKGAIRYDTTEKRRSTGKHFLEVRGRNGGYTVYITRTERRVSEPAGQDFPESTSTEGSVKVNKRAVTGNVANGSDKDAFAVLLKAGKSYQIDLLGDEPTAYGGTLTDSYLRLMSPTYTTILDDAIVDLTNSGVQSSFGILNDDGGTGDNARIEIDVHVTGLYFIQAEGASGATGTYKLQITKTS